MTWTYLLTDLATNAKDQVRVYIGDTISTSPQLQDEEINFFITQRASIWGACAESCLSLSSKYSALADQAAGASKIAYSQTAKAYAVRAAQFNARSSLTALPYAGGISLADKLNQEQDADRVTPQFNIGMDDNLLPVSPGGNILPDKSVT